MKKKLTSKQKGFADDIIDGHSATKAALKNYDVVDYGTAGVIAHENLRKPNIREYIEGLAPGAISRIEKLSKTAKNEQVRLSANKDLADRAGLKAVEKSDVNVSGGLDLITLLRKADKEE